MFSKRHDSILAGQSLVSFNQAVQNVIAEAQATGNNVKTTLADFIKNGPKTA